MIWCQSAAARGSACRRARSIVIKRKVHELVKFGSVGMCGMDLAKRETHELVNASRLVGTTVRHRHLRIIARRELSYAPCMSGAFPMRKLAAMFPIRNIDLHAAFLGNAACGRLKVAPAPERGMGAEGLWRMRLPMHVCCWQIRARCRLCCAVYWRHRYQQGRGARHAVRCPGAARERNSHG